MDQFGDLLDLFPSLTYHICVSENYHTGELILSIVFLLCLSIIIDLTVKLFFTHFLYHKPIPSFLIQL